MTAPSCAGSLFKTPPIWLCLRPTGVKPESPRNTSAASTTRRTAKPSLPTSRTAMLCPRGVRSSTICGPMTAFGASNKFPPQQSTTACCATSLTFPSARTNNGKLMFTVTRRNRSPSNSAFTVPGGRVRRRGNCSANSSPATCTTRTRSAHYTASASNSATREGGSSPSASLHPMTPTAMAALGLWFTSPNFWRPPASLIKPTPPSRARLRK